MWETLERAFAAQGFEARIVPAGRLDDLKRETAAVAAGPYSNGHAEYIARRTLTIDASGIGFAVQSLVIVATPSRARTAVFALDAGQAAVTIPPTYADYDEMEAMVLQTARDCLAPLGRHAEQADRLPKKLLAARSGLAEYGRNNICYVDGIGSHMHLFALFTDMPPAGDAWLPLRFMDQCEGCGACVRACPTGAIDANAPVINADRCLTAFNEDDGRTPFPDWMDASTHNCLVGCMRCQACCPANAGLPSAESFDFSFDRAETQIILSHETGEAYPEAVEEKIRALGIWNYRDALPRNLLALISKAASPSKRE